MHQTKRIGRGGTQPAGDGLDFWLRAAFVLQFLLGLALIFSTPLMGAPDEFYHWQRVEQISEGHFIAKRVGGEWGGKIDRSAFDYQAWFLDRLMQPKPLPVSDAWNEADRLSSLPPTAVRAPFPSTASFSPVAYLPQALGVFLGRTVGGNLFVQIVMAKVFALSVYFTLTWAMCRMLPGARFIAFAAVMMPSALFLAGSLGADGMNLIVPAMLIAICIRLRTDVDFALSEKRRWLIAVLLLACGLMKVTTVVFGLALLLIPASKFRNGRDRLVFLGICLGVGAVVALCWNLAFPFVPGIYWGNGGNPGAMMRMVIHEPVHALIIVRDTLLDWWVPYFQSYYGTVGAHAGFGYALPLEWFASVATIGLFLAVVDGTPRRDWRQTAWLTGIATVYLGALLSAFLIGFTRPGFPEIQGMNGRYLFPFYWLVLLAVASLRLTGSWPIAVKRAVFAGCIAAGVATTISALVVFHDAWVY